MVWLTIKKIILNFLRYFVFIAVIILFISCGGKNSSNELTEFFTFDKKNIGIEVSDTDLGIKFNPPLEWELIPSSLSKKMEIRNNPSDGFIYQPVYVFFNKSNGAVLSCGFVNSTDSTASKGSILNFYKGLITTKYKKANLVLSTFVHSRISFNMIQFDKENLTAYRLFFQNQYGQILQFEYSLGKDSLDLVLPAIKASIGSIRLID